MMAALGSLCPSSRTTIRLLSLNSQPHFFALAKFLLPLPLFHCEIPGKWRKMHAARGAAGIEWFQ